ncbi:MAG: hypothetical protein C0596_00200 [Marinilabiliales bacterium]|nr:MAG: hypothetical protein C0596_00200 [Marinilabiliales bacterium]
MKKLFLITLVLVASTLISIAQKVYNIPDKGDALVEITITTDKWEVTNDDGLFSIVPNDTGETARLITMIWASEDPTSETAIDDLANEAFDVVESLLVDIEWAEDITDFENNGITFVANDGYGYYVNEDGSRDQMSTTIMLLMPDETNILTLVFFGTNDAYDKWEESLLDVILSMKPAK